MADKIRVILFKEGDAWLAQGLEHDICVQAPTMKELYGRFEVAVHLESEEPGGLDRIGPAPQHFHKLWNDKAASLAPEWESDPFYEYAIAA
ncbi:MAG TPA: hypothetical protein GYA10_09395 [Alphaproteobacteria bacterium]|nr:hypothetical protein [Alphaproteobacteria bacterium]